MLSKYTENELKQIEERLDFLSKHGAFSYQLILVNEKTGYYSTTYRVRRLGRFRDAARTAWKDVVDHWHWFGLEDPPVSGVSNMDEEEEEEK